MRPSRSDLARGPTPRCSTKPATTETDFRVWAAEDRQAADVIPAGHGVWGARRAAHHPPRRREQYFAGQSAELAAVVPGATLVRFTQAEGASHHCQPMARELIEQRMFDWLDEQVS